MSRTDWWDDLYGTDTGQDTNRDTTTHDRTRRDKRRKTLRHVGRTVTLQRRPEGPLPLDELTADTSQSDTRRPVDTSKDRATKRRDTENTTSDATGKPDATPDTTETEDATPDPDTTEHKRSAGKRVGDWLSKAQQGAVKVADEIATNTKEGTSEESESAAGQERLARALEVITSALRTVEPSRTWLPPFVGKVGAFLLFNISAAAAGYYPADPLGYPDWAPAVLVYDYVHYFDTDDGDWLIPLLMGVIPPLLCALVFDWRARDWNSSLRWLMRIPLAATTAGALAATWQPIVQLTTGASS